MLGSNRPVIGRGNDRLGESGRYTSSGAPIIVGGGLLPTAPLVWCALGLGSERQEVDSGRHENKGRRERRPLFYLAAQVMAR